MTADHHDPFAFLDGAYADAFEAIEDKSADTLERQALMKWRTEIIAAREALKGIRSEKKRQEVTDAYLAHARDPLDRRIRQAVVRECLAKPLGRGRPPKGLAPQPIEARRVRHTQRVEDERVAILDLLADALALVDEKEAKALMARSSTAMRGILRAEMGHLFKRWLPEHALEQLTPKGK